MRNLIYVFPILALAGCATSSAGLYQMSVEHRLSGSKSAQEWATCTADLMQGSPTLRGSGGHWWLTRDNGYGIPIIRWDFTDQPGGGSIAELRANAITGAAKDKLARCAN